MTANSGDGRLHAGHRPFYRAHNTAAARGPVIVPPDCPTVMSLTICGTRIVRARSVTARRLYAKRTETRRIRLVIPTADLFQSFERARAPIILHLLSFRD